MGIVERRYMLTKIKAGDYLLPSNDAKTLWRLSTYTDGRINGLESGPWEATYWGVWRWNGRREDVAGIARTILDEDWQQWQLTIDGCDTRAEAIEAALRMEAS